MEKVEEIMVSKKGDNFTDVQYTPLQVETNFHQLSHSILIVGLIGVSILMLYKESYGKAISDTVSVVSLIIIVFGVAEIFLRVYNSCFELGQFRTKYGGDIVNVFSSFNLNTPSWVCIAVSFGLFLILYIRMGNTVEYIWSFGPTACIPALLIVIATCRLVGLSNPTSNTLMDIKSMSGVDYGTGMAYSYFYGYLAIILPSDGKYNPGLCAKMNDYEDNENVTIAVKKLFILIPESGHIPPDLKEASNNWLESTKSLESEVRDRAGVKRRSYKNTVYKIHPGGDEKGHRPVYVTTEGATPMLTFWEILHHSHPHTKIYREHQKQIIASFYTTLQNLLDDDPRCRDACELVYYNDYDAKNKKVNVGEVLLRRIRNQAASMI